MTPTAPRVRMFAGPNGSGKTSLVRSLAKEFRPDGAFWLHAYLNADDLLLELRNVGIDLSRFGLPISRQEIEDYVRQSSRFAALALPSLQFRDGRLWIQDQNSYVAAAITDFLRERLLQQRRSFAFETVMSHPGKVEFLRTAVAAGYRTYLYFVATQDPVLNVERVRGRADRGGHDVPPEKVVKRYTRAIALLPEAVRHSTRAFFFDNSGNEPIWLAERDSNGTLQLKIDESQLPEWFRHSVLEDTGV